MSPNSTQEQVRCQRCGAEIPDTEVARRAAQLSGRLGGAAGKGSPARRRAAVYASHCRWSKVKAARAAVSALLILGAAAWAPAQSNLVLVRDLTVTLGPPPPPPELWVTPKYALVVEDGRTTPIGMKILPKFRQVLLENNLKLLQSINHAGGFPHPFLMVGISISHIKDKAVAINVAYSFHYGFHQRGVDGFQMLFTGDDDETLPELESSALAHLKNDLFTMK